MSANPFAALGEDGPNPVAAKGAKFLFFPSLSSKIVNCIKQVFALFLAPFQRRMSERVNAICERNRYRESSARDLFHLDTNRNECKYVLYVRIDWFQRNTYVQT